ncbi:MAG: DUF2513 domain-containing protein [Nitrospira sp.]|nr:DUF2513 domain-containing protein [Nitrospira sp.]
MKRDWDLVRKILLQLEEQDCLASDDVQGHDTRVVSYHIGLLNEAGLIKAGPTPRRTGSEQVWSASSLTWSGHEFLDQIRADSMWGQIKRTAREKGLDLSFDVVCSLAKGLIGSLADS